MKKTGFKTFVCSFVFSLFIMLVINGLFFYTPKTSSNELKIPTQNISLFFLDPQKTANLAEVKPIKKIALSLPTTPSLSLSTSVTAELSPPPMKVAEAEVKILESKAFDDSLMFDSVEDDDLLVPLKHKNKPVPKLRTPPAAKTKDAAKPRSLAKNSPKLALANDSPKETPKKEVTSITDPENDKDQGGWETGNDEYSIEKVHKVPKKLLVANNEAKPVPQKAIQSITDSDNDTSGDYDTGNDDYSTDNVHKAPKKLLMANNEAKPVPQKAIQSITDSDNDTSGDYDTGNDDYSADNSPQKLLIPLQRDFANINANANNNIKIAKSAEDNQIAMVSGNTPINSMINEKEDIGSGVIKREPEKEEQKSEEKDWETMAEKSGEESPWVAAKGTKYPKNNTVLSADYYKNMDNEKIDAALNGKTIPQNKDNEVKLASDMVKNILIPIPDDILNDENLTPQLESSNKVSRADSAATEREMIEKGIAVQEIKKELAKEEMASLPERLKDDSKSSSLLKSITSIFSSTPASPSKEERVVGVEGSSNSFIDRVSMRNNSKKNGQPSKILPAEMRLSFQPNRAEISGTTLKWLQAFANKVNQDSSVILEVRIDGTSSYALQQKRLNLLHNILTNKGVDYSKINTVFTSREPNSFIIRTVRINSNNDRDVKEKKDQAAYYQSW